MTVTPKWVVHLRRDAREMGQRQVNKGQRAEARRKEWTAAVAMAALSGNVGDSVALPAGAADLC